MYIKVTRRDNNEAVFELTGHEGPVLSLDTCVAKNLLASASGDGTLRIWNLVEKQEIKCISGFEKVKSFYAAKTFSKLFWYILN